MVSKSNLGVAPVWIQWQLIREGVGSEEWVCSLVVSGSTVGPLTFTDFIPKELPESVVKIITEFAGSIIMLDPPWRTGNLSIQKTSDLWESLTVEGRLGLTKTNRDKANNETGPSFKPPIYNFHADKQNDGIFHLP